MRRITRRLVTVSGLAAVLVVATTAYGGPEGRPPAGIAADVRSHVPTAPLLIAAEPATGDVALVASVRARDAADLKQVTAAGIGSDQAGEPTAEQPAPFDRLWLLTAGVVALLLLVWIVRIQLLWWRRPVQKSRNEMSPTDVSRDG